jgi:hypothetical protein
VPGVGEVFYIVNPGYGLSVDPEYFPYAVFPKAEREYDALELTFDRRFADNWSLRGYYRLSRLWGNYSGLANADEQNSFGDPYNPVGTSARRDPNTSRLFDNVAATYDANGNLVYGRLATDRPHQFGAQFLYSFDFGFSVGVNQYIASGTPISEIATTPPDVEFYPKGRGNLGDTPWIYQTDLSLWQTFNFNRIDFSIGLTVLNLFDSDTETRIYSHRTIDDLPLTEAEFFAGFNYDSLVETVDADGAFGMPDTFQPARELRLSFKLEF